MPVIARHGTQKLHFIQSGAQLDMEMDFMDVLNSSSDYKTAAGLDTRNYGAMDGIPISISSWAPDGLPLDISNCNPFPLASS